MARRVTRVSGHGCAKRSGAKRKSRDGGNKANTKRLSAEVSSLGTQILKDVPMDYQSQMITRSTLRRMQQGDILKLNDNCLIEILKHLPTRDCYTLERTHPRFRVILSHIYATRRSISLNDETDKAYPLWYLEKLCRESGPNLKLLHLHYVNSVTAKKILSRFKAVSLLILEGITVPTVKMLPTYVEYLEIGDCFVNEERLTEWFEQIGGHVKEVIFTGQQPTFRKYFLKGLDRVEKLHFIGTVEGQLLDEFLVRNRNTLQDIETNFRFGESSLNVLAELPKLRRISIGLQVKSANSLPTHGFESLEEIEMIGSNLDITDAFLRNLRHKKSITKMHYTQDSYNGKMAPKLMPFQSLVELQIDWLHTIRAGDEEDLIDVVSGIPSLHTLDIGTTGEVTTQFLSKLWHRLEMKPRTLKVYTLCFPFFVPPRDAPFKLIVES